MELHVRLPADPASVPQARRLVADALTAWGWTSLVNDAELCVSELAGNAALHSTSTFMEIVVRTRGDALLVSVADDGVHDLDDVVPRPIVAVDDAAALFSLDDEPTTGRGLAIVAILARDWGVEAVARGKRVWAELAEAREPGPVPQLGTEPPGQLRT